MIIPTVGRVVWFWDSYEEGKQPMAALIAHVWSDTCVNLAAFDASGMPTCRTSVELWHGEGRRPQWPHCAWMPYQKGQAAKTEQLEALVTGGVSYREPIENDDRHKPTPQDPSYNR